MILPATLGQHISIALENLATIYHVVAGKTGHLPLGKGWQQMTVFAQERSTVYQSFGGLILHRTTNGCASAGLGIEHHLRPPGRHYDVVFDHRHRIRRHSGERDGAEVGNSSPFTGLENAHPGKLLPHLGPKSLPDPVDHENLQLDLRSLSRESLQAPGEITPAID
jgi:hypothetical protein